MRDMGGENQLRGRRLLAALGAWLLASVSMGAGTFFLLKVLVPGWAADPQVLSPIIVAEVYALLIVAMAAVFRPGFRASVALNACSFWQIAQILGAWLLAYLITWAAESAFVSRTWSATVHFLLGIGSDDGRLAGARAPLAVIILLRACLLAPIGEELLFRGALYTWLRHRWSAPVTIGLTALGHTVIHGYPPVFPLVFLLGIGAGWMRERSGSSVPSLVAHVVHNAVWVAIAYWTTGWTARLPWGQG